MGPCQGPDRGPIPLTRSSEKVVIFGWRLFHFKLRGEDGILILRELQSILVKKLEEVPAGLFYLLTLFCIWHMTLML